MDSRENTKKTVYVIDSDFRIVYSNSELIKRVSDERKNAYCYDVIGREPAQCKICPIRKENQGEAILFDYLHNQWIKVTAAPIEIPGKGACHVVLMEEIEHNGKNFFYSTAGRSDYNELLKLNYTDNDYQVVYHGERTKVKGHLSGTIDDVICKIAEKQVHPDDRQRFCDFWLLDRVGTEGVPDEMQETRRSEFRQVMDDGGYRWVQQVLIPIRQGSENEVFINSFFGAIDTPYTVADDDVDTGLCNKALFFRRMEEMNRHSDDDVPWCLAAIDIEKLKLFNEWYGHHQGDLLLEDIAGCLKDFQERHNGIAGYFGNDDFALFMPYEETRIEELYQIIADKMKSYSDKINMLPAIGVYEITDRKLPALKAYDRAKLACTSVKGNYIVRIKKFDREMLDNIESEYLLFSDIQKAFKNREFSFVLQPKCNIKSGKIVGAEALARWNNEEKGAVSPGVFIPFMEKTGYITQLDAYIWEEVCRWQRGMLDRGADTIPVSVNVSREDLYSVDVPAYFSDLIQKYGLTPKLLEIEITESAYVTDDGFVNKAVEKLRQSGFRVLMDDFGSAYSSLNMLKDIAVDTLKMDMRFLDLNEANASKGLEILEIVCNMANILGIDIIVEGVETEEQRNHLLTMRCHCGQGYYFYKPLAVEQFEKELQHNIHDDIEDVYDEKIERLYLKDLLGQDIFSEIMINNMLGAVAFYNVCGDHVKVIRYNEQYATLLGNTTFSSETELRADEQLSKEEFRKILGMFDEAKKNKHMGAEADIRRHRQDGTNMWLNMKTFFLHEQNGNAVYYSSLRDITKAHAIGEVLQFMNNDMPGGYYRHRNNEGYDFTYISKRFLDIFGFTREEIREKFDNKFINMVHPDDREAVINGGAVAEGHASGNYSQFCRMKASDGYILVVDQSRLVQYEGNEIFQGIILCDLDKLKQTGIR